MTSGLLRSDSWANGEVEQPLTNNPTILKDVMSGLLQRLVSRPVRPEVVYSKVVSRVDLIRYRVPDFFIEPYAPPHHVSRPAKVTCDIHFTGEHEKARYWNTSPHYRLLDMMSCLTIVNPLAGIEKAYKAKAPGLVEFLADGTVELFGGLLKARMVGDYEAEIIG